MDGWGLWIAGIGPPVVFDDAMAVIVEILVDGIRRADVLGDAPRTFRDST